MSEGHDSGHEYDGIREYDNPLPGWWVLLFWITIVFSPVYVLWYHFGAGPSEVEEYNVAMMEQAELESKAMLAAGDPTDDSIRQMGANASVMAGAAQVYASRCATCHGARGEGKIGPNLTDPFWLHGGKPTQIYQTIADGVPDKGMQPWKMQLPPVQVLAMAAYVDTLRGSDPPGAKAPQGEKEPI